MTTTPVLRKGQILISTIALGDHNFRHSLVLICEHQDDEGSYGLILNRPIEATPEIVRQAPFAEGRLFQGGPVQPESLQILHPYGDYVPGSHTVLPNLFYGGDFSVLEKGFQNHGFDPEECRFFLGYAGWQPGQLDSEIEKGAWVVVSGNHDLILRTPADKQWSHAVKQHKQADPLFTNFPENPEWN